MRVSSGDISLRVLERRPDHVLDAGGFGGFGDVLRLLISFAGEVFQKLVTAYTPCAPANAFRLSTSSRSALTTSAPAAASAFALSLLVSRVIARAPNRRWDRPDRAHEPAAL